MSQANRINTTRRALIASVAGTAAATICATPALAAVTTDPIFAAIYAHRVSQEALHVACQVSGKLYGHEPEADAINAATAAAADYFETTTTALTDITPTTLAGVLALLAYIDDFNRGEVSGSEYLLWGYEEYGDETVKRVDGRNLEMPWPFWVMRNIQSALLNITATA